MTGEKEICHRGHREHREDQKDRNKKTMAEIRAIVLRAAGINCDMETEYALESAGAKAQRVHINRIIEDKNMLAEFQIMVLVWVE